MTAPAIAAQRFGGAVLVGVALGLIYGFLRPLRPGYTAFSDLAFLLALVWGWVYLALEICRGEFRFSYCFGMLLGGFGWESLVGRQTRGIFSAFWKSMGQIRDIALFPCKKIYKILKKMIASGEKWVTIRWSNRRHMTRKLGGKPYGRNKRIFQPDQAGSDAHPQYGEGDSDHRHRIVYGGADQPADLYG